MAADIQHAYRLLEQLSPGQFAAVVQLLETMVDPVTTALRNAPVDDEPETEEEKQAVARSKEWFRRNEGTPFDQVVAELGFTIEQVGHHAQEDEKDPAA